MEGLEWERGTGGKGIRSHPHTWHSGTPRSELLCYEPSLTFYVCWETSLIPAGFWVWVTEWSTDRRFDLRLCCSASLMLTSQTLSSWNRAHGLRSLRSSALFHVLPTQHCINVFVFPFCQRASECKNSPTQCGCPMVPSRLLSRNLRPFWPFHLLRLLTYVRRRLDAIVGYSCFLTHSTALSSILR